MKQKINFASDNHAGIHVQVLDHIIKANVGSVPAYGTDSITELAISKMKEHFGGNAEIFFVGNGTAANVLGLKSAVRSYEAILCSNLAHIHTSECGAPEALIGCKLIAAPSTHGKIDPSTLEIYFERKKNTNSAPIRVISVSQSTEYGTVYSLQELKQLAAFAQSKNCYFHVDGARFSNAVAAIGCTLGEMSNDIGIDILSFGGTKNGLMSAEAIVIFNPQLKENFPFIRKQGLHLTSKMRFVSAQFLAYFEGELWRKNASHSNQMALHLKDSLLKFIPHIHVTQAVQSNAVFARIPEYIIEKLLDEFHFHVWNKSLNEVRLMCSVDTTLDEIKLFSSSISMHLEK